MTKEVTFDAAHMLSNYHGLCNNLHGHTYRLRVKVTTPSTADMVIDFNILKQTITNVVTDKYDHALILASPDYRSKEEQELYLWAKHYEKRTVEMSLGRPTCENMLRDILHALQEEIPNLVVSGQLWETPTSFAETIQ